MIEQLIQSFSQTQATEIIIVTNEVGMGVVPESALGRRFRDLAGLAHQRLAAIADEVYFAAMGLVVRLKPAPVVTVNSQQSDKRNGS